MYAVVMAGGSGTRFWPASRRERPKQFLNVTGKNPLIMEACDRLRSIAPDEHLILILGRRHGPEVRRLFADRPVHILLEPIGRNTAPCIGLGALYARHMGCEEAVAFLPADHFIADEEAFTTADLQTARDYLTSGEYYWNGGIFVATPERILREMETHLPAFYQGLIEIDQALEHDDRDIILEKIYERTEAISFDYAVMEKTRSSVFVVPCDCGWSDVGSWGSLYDLRGKERDDQGNLKEGDVLLEGCEGSFVSARGERLVACLGLRKVLVVDTQDALLVADLEKTQDIRKIVNRLREKGKESLL